VRLSPGPARVFGANAGLGDRTLFQILDDDQRFLWLGSSPGLPPLSRGGLDELADPDGLTLEPLSHAVDARPGASPAPARPTWCAAGAGSSRGSTLLDGTGVNVHLVIARTWRSSMGAT
jgi:hypothetical protein